MADPPSISGAAAAASQLLQQGSETTKFVYDLYPEVQHAPEFIRKQVVQIEQLIDLARLVIQNLSLQTPLAASILSTCLRCVEKFRGILTKIAVTPKDGLLKEFQKAFTTMVDEREILALFENLEREKSSLTFCIQEIDS
jgi:hypothetical protein